MTARALMLQGTASDVGKSTLVAGLCRLARRRGIGVAPFKPQNMSNNAAACAGGGEIGRAQALQARAAGIEPTVHMNPVLLKPQSDCLAQVVVQGVALRQSQAADYMRNRGQLLDSVMTSFEHLADDYDLILVEGAGSAAETNLRRGDIANMGFARRAGVPVCLVADIDRGGVIASVVGTQRVLESGDSAQIVSFIINRFRGDPSLFDDGMRSIEQLTGWPSRGLVPWLASVSKLPPEDAVVLQQPEAGSRSDSQIKISVPMLSRIANFDDLDPLRMEPAVDLQFIPPGSVIPQNSDVIILPGSKSTIADMQFLREQGWHHDIIAHARNGGHVLGLCGGYQLLGEHINDSHGVDGTARSIEGLGLLQVSTLMQASKKVQPVSVYCARSRLPIDGYEIHVGETTGTDTARPFSIAGESTDGAISADEKIAGTYLHGLFSNDEFRRFWLEQIRTGASSNNNYHSSVERALDQLADELEKAVQVDALLADAGSIQY